MIRINSRPQIHPVVMVLEGMDRLTGSMEMEEISSKPMVMELMKRSVLSRLGKLLVRSALATELEP